MVDGSATSCFAAFYVKWLESSGVRVAVLRYDLDPDVMAEAIRGVNGVLFTGGGESLKPNTPYYEAANRIFKQVLDINDQGTFLPLWGTCMGFQLLTILAANNQSVLEHHAFDSEDISLPLLFSSEAADSRLVQAMPSHIHSILQRNVTSNLHHDGVKPETYATNGRLKAFYRLISTSVDRKGNPFGSTLEARNYPITATQWHPERPQFEWRLHEGFSHTMETFEAMQWMGRYFSSLVHQSNQSFANATLEAELSIYRHHVTLDPTGGSYQFYIFG
ncbi:hypothetical protein PTSG_07318 [Salpingoeca rosetta]|uniref:folate gamma-glutamyl hydrolase n=1 Tax=Salpingoeca rosetta (strain ATCC 50818 / BSB-021) TaxID=946362 RepID=F2UJ27_SALR5|nr:uncharacterized protein PTSG_07318 [Salpingoeca rosetta]EGD76975.1 hypothetical protein PTSG_07318 [Salpingoeca rosetta]|eukprot:XP_004990815.1 hypothetical protein PTSG_07318 [Salpingoeca rosetta]